MWMVHNKKKSKYMLLPKCNPEAGEGEQEKLSSEWAAASPEHPRALSLWAGQELAEQVDDKGHWLHGVILCKQVTQVLRVCLALGHEPKDSLRKERERSLFSLHPGI